MQKNILSLFLLVFLAACHYFPSLDEAEKNNTLDDPFREGLRKGYVELAESELAQGDRDDAGHYRYKVRTVVRGHSLDPENLTTRNMPTEHLNELAEARNFLMTAFAKDAQNIAPEIAAEAQVKFDCWVEQQEENFQPEDIKACRQAFKIAEDKLAAAIQPKPEEIVKPEPKVMPGTYYVFFDFDKSNIDLSAEVLLKKVADQVSEFLPDQVYIAGHADRAGSEKYNQKLSERRAEAVSKKLMEYGVYGALIKSEAFGEKAPKVPTKDGVKEPQNRFVEIKFIK